MINPSKAKTQTLNLEEQLLVDYIPDKAVAARVFYCRSNHAFQTRLQGLSCIEIPHKGVVSLALGMRLVVLLHFVIAQARILVSKLRSIIDENCTKRSVKGEGFSHCAQVKRMSKQWW